MMTRIWWPECNDPAVAKAMKPSETFCQRLLPQSRLMDPNGFICNANFSFMKIRAAINVSAIPSRPICRHCAGCMLVMMPKHPIIYAAFVCDHSWCQFLLASAKTDSTSGDKFERYGWSDLPALSSVDSCQCCAIKTSFDSKTKRRKNWWDRSFTPYLPQRNTCKLDRSRIGKRLSFDWRTAAASKNCQIYQLD